VNCIKHTDLAFLNVTQLFPGSPHNARASEKISQFVCVVEKVRRGFVEQIASLNGDLGGTFGAKNHASLTRVNDLQPPGD
jgi:hypothetical protein